MKKIAAIGRVATIAFYASIVLKALIAFFKVLADEGLIEEIGKGDKDEDGKD